MLQRGEDPPQSFHKIDCDYGFVVGFAMNDPVPDLTELVDFGGDGFVECFVSRKEAGNRPNVDPLAFLSVGVG